MNPIPQLHFNEVNSRMTIIKTIRCSLPLYRIVNQFSILLINQKSETFEEGFIKNLQILSKEKLEYYRSTRFGFIKEFFSKIRNLLTIGIYISSGQRGSDLTTFFLSNLQREKKQEKEIVEDTSSHDIRSTLDSPRKDQSINQEEEIKNQHEQVPTDSEQIRIQTEQASPEEESSINQEEDRKSQHEKRPVDSEQIETSEQSPLEEESINQEEDRKNQHEHSPLDSPKGNQSIKEEFTQKFTTLSVLKEISNTFEPILKMLQFEKKELAEKTKLLRDSFTVLWIGIGKMNPTQWIQLDNNRYKLKLEKDIDITLEIPIIKKNVNVTIEKELILEFSKSKKGNPVISFPKLNILPTVGKLKSIEATQDPNTKETSYNILAQIRLGFFSTQFEKSYSHSKVISNL